MEQSKRSETAVLGGGCFWCLEAVFDDLQGVASVESGYMGGRTSAPSYESVCSGNTGHAEVVRIEFDPQVVSFSEILEVFFAIHDPTTLNLQGSDVGTQYRSVIYYQSADQKSAAERMIARLDEERIWPDPIVTEIAQATAFYPAEAYHRQYFARNASQPYCQFVVAPKVAKFRKKFLSRRKKTG